MTLSLTDAYVAWHPSLVRFARGTLGTWRTESEDVVQTVWMRLTPRWESIRGKSIGHQYAYVRRCVERAAIDYIRRQAHPTAPRFMDAATELQVSDTLADPELLEQTVISAMMAGDLWRQIRVRLARVSAHPDRDALLLVFVAERYNAHTMARALRSAGYSIQASQIKMAVYRVRQIFRKDEL